MADVVPRITVQQAADEIGVDAANPRLPRLIGVYDAFITRQIGNATVPEVIAAEAVMRMVAYAFDVQTAPGSTWANIYQNSGARRLLSDYLPRREVDVVEGAVAQVVGPTVPAGEAVDQAARDAAAAAAAASAVNTGFLSTFGARVTAVIENVVPAWARRAQPPAGTGGGTTLPAFEQATTQGLFSRAGNLFWQVVREVPIAGAVGHVLTRYGRGDGEYRFQAVPPSPDATARASAADAARVAAGANANADSALAAARVNTQFLSTFTARVTAVITAVVPAWARAAQPPAGGGGVDQTARDSAADAIARLGALGVTVTRRIREFPDNVRTVIQAVVPSWALERTPPTQSAQKALLLTDDVARTSEETWGQTTSFTIAIYSSDTAIGGGLIAGNRNYNPVLDYHFANFSINQLDYQEVEETTYAIVMRRLLGFDPIRCRVAIPSTGVLHELRDYEVIASDDTAAFYYLGSVTRAAGAAADVYRAETRVEPRVTRFIGALSPRPVMDELFPVPFPLIDVEPQEWVRGAGARDLRVLLRGFIPRQIDPLWENIDGTLGGIPLPAKNVDFLTSQGAFEVVFPISAANAGDLDRNNVVGARIPLQLWVQDHPKSQEARLHPVTIPVVDPPATPGASRYQAELLHTYPRPARASNDHDLKSDALASALASNGGETLTIIATGSFQARMDWFNKVDLNARVVDSTAFRQQDFILPDAGWRARIVRMVDGTTNLPFLRISLLVNLSPTSSINAFLVYW